MKQHIIWTPKFKVGNVIKYFGDIYEITGINQYGYNVNVIEYRDQEDVKTGLGRNVEHIMEFIAEGWSEYRNNPKPRPVAKQIGKRLMAIRKEKLDK